MTMNRLADYLDHMRQAIADAQSFTELRMVTSTSTLTGCGIPSRRLCLS